MREMLNRDELATDVSWFVDDLAGSHELKLGAELGRLRALVAEANQAQERAMADFAAELPPRAAVSTLPELERDVRDVPGLLRLAAALSA